MPPKKEKSTFIPIEYQARKAQAPLKPIENVPPLKQDTVVVMEMFPEWNEESMHSENWYSSEEPFTDDVMDQLYPKSLVDGAVLKRPRQYLPLVENDVGAVVEKSGKGKAAKKDTMANIRQDENYGYIVRLPEEDQDLRNIAIQDFCRKWSPVQTADFEAWEREERRIAYQKAQREAELLDTEAAMQSEVADNSDPELSDGDLSDDEDEMHNENKRDEEEDMEKTEQDDVNTIVKPSVPGGDHINVTMASIVLFISQFRNQLPSETPFLWEAIFPKNEAGVPIYNPGGKYCVKLFVKGQWRKVMIDDTFPVNKKDKAKILSSTDTSELWPSILAKAIYKVLYHCNYFSDSNTEVTNNQLACAVSSLTGWWSYLTPKSIFDDNWKKMLPQFKLPPTTPTENEEEEVVMEEPSCKVAPELLFSESQSLSGLFAVPQAKSMSNIRNGELVVPYVEIDNDGQSSLCIISDGKALVAQDSTLSDQCTKQFDFFTHHFTKYSDHYEPIRAPESGKRTVPVKDPMYLVIDASDDADRQEKLKVLLTLNSIAQNDENQEDHASTVVFVSDTYIPKNAILQMSTTQHTSMVLDVNQNMKSIYRVLPKQEIGYLLSVHSTVPVLLLDVMDHWKSTLGLVVSDSTTEYKSFPADQWTVLCRYRFTVTEEEYVKVLLHLEDPEIRDFVTMYTIDHDTCKCTRHDLLETGIQFSTNTSGYSIVAIARHRKLPVPAGKMRILLGAKTESIRDVKKVSIATSCFHGMYMPNNLAQCFRDILTVSNDIAGCCSTLRFYSPYPSVVVKLDIIDIDTGEVVLSSSGQGCTYIYHLPKKSVEGDTVNYIVRGSYDRSKWLLPPKLTSLEPFHYIEHEQEGESSTFEWHLSIVTASTITLCPDASKDNIEAEQQHEWEVGQTGRSKIANVCRQMHISPPEEYESAMSQLAESERALLSLDMERKSSHSTDGLQIQSTLSGNDKVYTEAELTALCQTYKDASSRIPDLIAARVESREAQIEKWKNSNEQDALQWNSKQEEIKKQRAELHALRDTLIHTPTPA